MSKMDGLHPDLRRRIRALRAAAPFPIGITSGYRSSERQRQLWEAWQRRDPGANPANRPGTSKHERTLNGQPAAEAVDLDFPGWRGSPEHTDAVRWVHGNAHLFGLHFPIRSEDWHAESNGRPFEEDDMTDEDRKLLREVHQMLTALGAPRRADHKDRDTSRIDLGDSLTVLTKEIRAVRAEVQKLTGGKS